MKRQNWAELRAAEQGTTPEQVMAQVAEECGHKRAAIAAMMGMEYPSAQRLLKKYGVGLRNSFEFVAFGVLDTFSGHCRRHGVNPINALSYRALHHEMTKIEALERYVSAMQRGGMRWTMEKHMPDATTSRDFEFHGVIANFTQHCSRLGLDRANVAVYKRRLGLRPDEALRQYLAGVEDGTLGKRYAKRA